MSGATALSFRTEEDWALMEQFCQLAGGREDTWYATNIEIVDYMADAARLQYTAAGDKVCNPKPSPSGSRWTAATMRSPPERQWRWYKRIRNLKRREQWQT